MTYLRRRMIRNVPFLSVVTTLVLAASLHAQPAEGQYHRCPAAGKDYAPGHPLSQRSAGAGYDLSLVIGPDDWYDPSALGKEAKDWLKAAGVSYFSFWRPGTWPKNRFSALVGFRMLAGRRYEVCAYVNDPAGGFRYDGVVTAAAGDTVRVTYRLVGTSAKYTLQSGGQREEVVFPDFASLGRQVAVGPWHGGSAPAPAATGIWTRLEWID